MCGSRHLSYSNGDTCSPASAVLLLPALGRDRTVCVLLRLLLEYCCMVWPAWSVTGSKETANSAVGTLLSGCKENTTDQYSSLE